MTRKLQKDIQGATSSANGTATQAISLARLVRSFAAEDEESRIYAGFVAELVRQQARIKLAYTLYAPTVAGFNAVLLGAVLAFGRAKVHDAASASDFAAFLFYTNRIQACRSSQIPLDLPSSSQIMALL